MFQQILPLQNLCLPASLMRYLGDHTHTKSVSPSKNNNKARELVMNYRKYITFTLRNNTTNEPKSNDNQEAH